MTKLHIDFETRSTVDLKKAGLDNYARHPTTDVWCMAWAFDDEDVDLWACDSVDYAGHALDHVAAGGAVYAHNAAFELAIWNNICVPRFAWPTLRTEQCRC